MTRRRRAAVAVALTLAPLGGGAPSIAATLADVEMADSVEVDGTTLVLNGLGLREATWLKVDVYVAGLYLPSRTADPAAILDGEGPRRLVVEFVRKVGRPKIVEAWRDGLEANTPGAGERFAAPLETLGGWVTDVAPGDRMTFTWLPERGLAVDIRGERQGVLEGAGFARAFWSVWLGPSPPNAGLKDGLLGR